MAKKKNSKMLWIVILLATLGTLAYWINDPGKGKPPLPPDAKRQDKVVLEKTGAGATADFTGPSWKVHSLVDEVLTSSKVRIQSQQDQKREVPRQQAEGLIRWHARYTLVQLPEDVTLDKFKEILRRTLLGSGELLDAATDQYQGQNVTRLDVGLKDKLEGDPVTLITDKLYIMKAKTSDPKAVLPAKERGKLAIIVDDFGYTGDPIAAFTAIERPLTFAVLPFHPFTQEAASRGAAAKHHIMLHLPMEPFSSAEQQEKTSITTTMTDQEIQQTVLKALANVPGVMGVNNHQGSKATADKRVMRTVLATLKAQQLFFVDSRTSAQSVAYDTAREMQIRTGENQLFLDNSSDVDYIKQQLRTAGRIAIRDGWAIVIGHARPNTAIALKDMIPELESEGVRLVYASQLLK